MNPLENPRRIKQSPSTLRTRYQTCNRRLSVKCLTCIFYTADRFMLVLGPVLIVLATSIIIGLTRVYFQVILPMLAGTNWVTTQKEWGEYWEERGYTVEVVENGDEITHMSFILLALSTPTGIAHTLVIIFFLANIIYNYYRCVTTSNNGPSYAIVVREFAQATGFVYPETEEEKERCKLELDRSFLARLDRRRREMTGSNNCSVSAGSAITNGNTNSSANRDEESQNISMPLMATANVESPSEVKINTAAQPTNNPQPIPSRIHNWQLYSPMEWSYCRYAAQPKPPRSHYDHVTKSLVLNMDHYCPWMFNVIGYFNYRYFFNFLWFVTFALFYGMGICYPPFRYLGSKLYREQVRSSNGGVVKSITTVTVKHWKSNAFIPTPNERTPVAFGFMLCLSVGCAVLCLGFFHLYLVLSAQTTIEFHGNMAKRRKAGWKNPYSTGNWRRNWEMIYGTRGSALQEDEELRHRGYFGYLIAMMPSNREPEFLPSPIDSKLVRRKSRHGCKKTDVELGSLVDTKCIAPTNIGLDESNMMTESRVNAANRGLTERRVLQAT